MGSNPPGTNYGPNYPYSPTYPSGSPFDTSQGSQPPSLDTIANDIIGQIPGIGYLEDALNIGKSLIPILGKLVQSEVTSHPFKVITALISNTPDALPMVAPDFANFYQWITKLTVGNIYQEFLRLGLGVDTSLFDDDGQKGVTTTDTMLGFAFVLQYMVAAVEVVGKGLFGGRWPESLSETLAKIPEEMGLSWALGTTIEEGFTTAVGRSVEEGINRQKRGNRIEWPQVRLMLKQHLFDQLTVDQHGKITGGLPSTDDKPGMAVFKALLANQGFPDEHIDLLAALADVQLPVGDIAQMWNREVIDDKEAKKLIAALGFSTVNTDRLFDLYVDKAETEASVTYRSIARQMFVNHLLTETQYRAILTAANYPKRHIDMDITGIKLEQDTGRLLESVTVIKQRYQHSIINADEARRELGLLNYAPSYITELLQTWDTHVTKKTHGLSQAKILSYYISGLIKRPDAYNQLVAGGLQDDTANFLLDHPTANEGVKQHARTPGLVTQAYLDGVIQLPALESAYTSAGVRSADLAWYVDIAKYKLSHKKGGPGVSQHLTTADIREAFKQGIFSFQQCVGMLVNIGWSSDDAMLLTEITNKGPYQPPSAPAFATIDDAALYMENHGYTVYPPPDPRLQAAESMLATSGFTWTSPAVNYGPPPPGI